MITAEILKRLRAELGYETLLRAQMYDWSKSFKEGRTEVGNMRRLCFLQGKLWPAFIWDSQRILFIDFLREIRTINAVYYSKLLKYRVKPAFRSK